VATSESEDWIYDYSSGRLRSKLGCLKRRSIIGNATQRHPKFRCCPGSFVPWLESNTITQVFPGKTALGM